MKLHVFLLLVSGTVFAAPGTHLLSCETGGENYYYAVTNEKTGKYVTESLCPAGTVADDEKTCNLETRYIPFEYFTVLFDQSLTAANTELRKSREKHFEETRKIDPELATLMANAKAAKEAYTLAESAQRKVSNDAEALSKEITAKKTDQRNLEAKISELRRRNENPNLIARLIRTHQQKLQETKLKLIALKKAQLDAQPVKEAADAKEKLALAEQRRTALAYKTAFNDFIAPPGNFATQTAAIETLEQNKKKVVGLLGDLSIGLPYPSSAYSDEENRVLETVRTMIDRAFWPSGRKSWNWTLKQVYYNSGSRPWNYSIRNHPRLNVKGCRTPSFEGSYVILQQLQGIKYESKEGCAESFSAGPINRVDVAGNLFTQRGDFVSEEGNLAFKGKCGLVYIR
jgi:hypothetical protein